MVLRRDGQYHTRSGDKSQCRNGSAANEHSYISSSSLGVGDGITLCAHGSTHGMSESPKLGCAVRLVVKEGQRASRSTLYRRRASRVGLIHRNIGQGLVSTIDITHYIELHELWRV
jgi:hypothetical protein